MYGYRVKILLFNESSQPSICMHRLFAFSEIDVATDVRAKLYYGCNQIVGEAQLCDCPPREQHDLPPAGSLIKQSFKTS